MRRYMAEDRPFTTQVGSRKPVRASHKGVTVPHDRNIGRLLRLIQNESSDLYALAALGVVLTGLSLIGLASQAAVLSAILAMLSLLSFSLLRTRTRLEALRSTTEANVLDRLLESWPADMEELRASATDVLLIGQALTRTIASFRRQMPASLARGATIRIVLMDPSAALPSDGEDGDSSSFRRIVNSLEELGEVSSKFPGLEVRTIKTTTLPTMNVLDPARPSGVVGIQWREFKPEVESRPVMLFRPSDGYWYTTTLNQANRIWEAAQPWPGPNPSLTAAPRRQFFTSSEDNRTWDVAAGAKELLITGVARNSLLTAHFHDIEQLLINGCRVRFLLIDPGSPAVDVAAERYYAERSATSLRARIYQSLNLLRELDRLTSGTIVVNVSKYALPMGIVAVASRLGGEFETIFAEYYTYQARGEPHFTVHKKDEFIFENLLGEAECLWRASRPAWIDGE